MTEEIKAAPAVATEVQSPVVQPPVVPPAAVTKPVVDDEPVWISERVRRAQAQALRDAGIKVGKDEDPREVAREAKEKKGKSKEALQAANAKIEELTSSTAALAIYAEAELASLSEAHRAQVKKLAGDSVAKTLETISILKMGGAFAAPVATPAAPAVAPPIAAPANTSPAGSAPEPASTTDLDVRAQYKQLKSSNPYLASQFILDHPELMTGKQ